MKHISVFVLAAVLGAAPMAFATNSLVDDSTHASATGGAGGDGGDANVRVHNSSSAGAAASQHQEQAQQQAQGQQQGFEAFNGNTTTVEAPDVKGMAKELAKHASSAAEVRSNSGEGSMPCGESTGISASSGLFGGGVASVTETCRAFRLQRLQKLDMDLNGGEKSYSTTLAEISYYGTWFPRFVLSFVSGGVLN